MTLKVIAHSMLVLMILLPLCLTPFSPIVAQVYEITVTLNPVADATIDSSSPYTNFGHDITLDLKYEAFTSMPVAIVLSASAS